MSVASYDALFPKAYIRGPIFCRCGEEFPQPEGENTISCINPNCAVRGRKFEVPSVNLKEKLERT